MAIREDAKQRSITAEEELTAHFALFLVSSHRKMILQPIHNLGVRCGGCSVLCGRLEQGIRGGGFEAWRRAQNNIGKFPDICARCNYYLTVIITFDVIK